MPEWQVNGGDVRQHHFSRPGATIYDPESLSRVSRGGEAMQREPFKGSANSTESAARPRFALLAVVATIVLAVVTSGIALAGGLGGPGEDASEAQPAWLTPPAAIMAAPSAPLARPEPAPNNVVVPAAPDPGPQLALPVPGRSSTAVDNEPQSNEPQSNERQSNERQSNERQSSGPPGNVAQRTQEPPLDASNPGPVRNTDPGKDEGFEFDPFDPTDEQRPFAVTPTVTVSRGQDTADGYCAAPDCAVLLISMRGFEPDTAYTIMPYTDEWGNFYPDETLTTDMYGELAFERFLFDGVGQVVWVVVQTPDGLIESNHLRLESG